MRNSRAIKCLLVCLFVVIVIMIYLDFYSINSDDCNCKCDDKVKNDKSLDMKQIDEAEWGAHTLCVLVPYRDRLEELLEFAPHLHAFLNKNFVRHHIIIINQIDQHRFNRASLINVGFLESKGKCDYISMHDVDLLPLNSELQYTFPQTGPYHLAAPHLHPRYHYKTFVGGILLLTREHFELVNGMSNRYWGWGLEDDEFFIRIKNAGLTISRPGNLTTGNKNTFLHLHDRHKRKRDSAKLFNQKEVTRKRDRVTGLNNVKYKLLKKHTVVIENAPVSFYNVELICDAIATPWCDPINQPINKSKVSKSTPAKSV